jgi:hypothetical protein
MYSPTMAQVILMVQGANPEEAEPSNLSNVF